jgi:elongation factor Ts
MNITATQVKELRDKTGAGMMECKKALGETGGDVEKAVDYLREQGVVKSAKLGSRATEQGSVFTYIHPGEQLGVLVEISCETDFVARTDDFKTLGKNIAMQVAAANPSFVSRDDVPEDVTARERDVLTAQAKAEGKPDHILDKMVEGRLTKFFEEICLLDQPYIRDDAKRVGELVTDTIAVLRENIKVKRFMRYQVGAE